jgi:coenzyme F420-0:L-glutamate ligase / coenzyme F420-1:gamma-L-glutamate ligase
LTDRSVDTITEDSLLDMLMNRRSLRRYQPDPIPHSVIKKLLTAAIWAPSAHNRQPWRFAVVETSDEKEGLAIAMGQGLRTDLTADQVPVEVINADVERSYQRITGAPLVIVLCLSMNDMDVYPDQRRQSLEWTMAVQSTAMAGQNLLLMASSLGLSACWMCAPLFCPDVVQQQLELPLDWEPQALITLGYPAQERQGDRKPLETSIIWK